MYEVGVGVPVKSFSGGEVLRGMRNDRWRIPRRYLASCILEIVELAGWNGG